MKKTGLLTIILLMLLFSLSAAPNWIGVQVLGWNSDITATISFLGSSTTGSAISNGSGIIISGSFYPSQGSSLSLGYQLGATSVDEITSNGITSTPDSDKPLTWRGGLSAQHRTDLSDFLSLEIGAGVLYEYYTESDTSGGITDTQTLETISLAATSNLLLHLSDSLSLVGGIDFFVPIIANAEVSSGGITAKPEIEIEGTAVQIKVGVAFSI